MSQEFGHILVVGSALMGISFGLCLAFFLVRAMALRKGDVSLFGGSWAFDVLKASKFTDRGLRMRKWYFLSTIGFFVSVGFGILGKILTKTAP